MTRSTPPAPKPNLRTLSSSPLGLQMLAVYPGTFDPITLGHLDVIYRASRLFGRVVVAVHDSADKHPLFSLSERVKLVSEATKGLFGISVEGFSGLLVDYLRAQNAFIVVRGLRELSDFQTEFQQAVINRKLYPATETVLIVTDAQNFYITSSMVKQIASLGGDIRSFVPPGVAHAIREKIKS